MGFIVVEAVSEWLLPNLEAPPQRVKSSQATRSLPQYDADVPSEPRSRDITCST